jgi:hypothetical protein
MTDLNHAIAAMRLTVMRNAGKKLYDDGTLKSAGQTGPKLSAGKAFPPDAGQKLYGGTIPSDMGRKLFPGKDNSGHKPSPGIDIPADAGQRLFPGKEFPSDVGRRLFPQ